ncbi:hypothetical protein X965_14305 [Morganella sp. EGD-HP17]|nr:hypothetical protein X965_14305 [Morganella sp. EGD-HP17]
MQKTHTSGYLTGSVSEKMQILQKKQNTNKKNDPCEKINTWACFIICI